MMVDFTYEQLKMIRRALMGEIIVMEDGEHPDLVRYDELLEEVDEMIQTAKKRGYGDE
jgi:hypothetical protein